jgi:hypothetical protein
MRDPNRKVIYMLWTVIAVLIIGGAVVGYLLVHKADELSTTNAELNGNVGSLREQLRQAKQTGATPSPTTSASPTPSPTLKSSASPTPSPTTSAKPQP